MSCLGVLVVQGWCTCLLLLVLLSEGREILVGCRPNSWKIPEPTNDTLNHWAKRTRFKVGDFLIWEYEAERDSVMQVTEEDYKRCKRSNPIGGYKERKTWIELDRSGPFFFISGEEGRCHKGERLIVLVLSPSHWPSSIAAPSTASASPQGSGILAVAMLVISRLLF